MVAFATLKLNNPKRSSPGASYEMGVPENADMKPLKGCCLPLEVPSLVQSFHKSRTKGHFKIDNQAVEK